MSTSGPAVEADERRVDARFGREALLVLGVLVVLTLGSIFVRTEAGWRWMARPGSRLDVAALLTGSVARTTSGTVIVGSAGERRPTARLPPLELEAGATYLLGVRAGPGGSFTIQGFDRRSKRHVHMHFPYRREKAEYGRLIGFGSEPARLRLTLVGGGGPLAIDELALWRLSPVARALAGSLGWIGMGLAMLFCWRHRRRWRRTLRRPRPVDDRVVSGALLVVSMAVFLAAPVQQVMDGRLVTLTSHRLIHEHSLSLPRDVVGDRLETYRLRELDGRIYHYAYTPVAILNTPFVWLFEQLGVSPVVGGVFEEGNEIGILRWIAALLAAGLVAVLYRLGRNWLKPLPSMALSLAFAFGTQIFSTVSRPFWSHGWALLLSAIAISLALAPRHRDRLGAIVAMVLLLAAACLCRPVVALSVLGVGALLWMAPASRWRFVFLVLWGALGSGGVAAIWLGVWPEILPVWGDVYASLPRNAIGAYLATSVAGTLFSPARGLLLYVPLFGWVAWVVCRHRRELAAPGVASVAALVVLTHWAALVGAGVWADGQVFGPRLFSDVLVWFFLLAALAVRWLLDLPPGRARRVQAGVACLCLAGSLFVNVRGATSPATWHWHWLERRPGWMIRGTAPILRPPRVWNWRNPQFLAGMLPPEPGLEARIEALGDN